MNFSRRNFVKLGGIAAVTGIGLSNQTFSFASDRVLASQTCQGFQPHIGTQFQLSNDSSQFLATLTDIKEYPAVSKNGECFSLEFSLETKQVNQATYDVYNPNFGDFQLFMTEGQTEKTPTLIAVINRI